MSFTQPKIWKYFYLALVSAAWCWGDWQLGSQSSREVEVLSVTVSNFGVFLAYIDEVKASTLRRCYPHISKICLCKNKGISHKSDFQLVSVSWPLPYQMRFVSRHITQIFPPINLQQEFSVYGIWYACSLWSGASLAGLHHMLWSKEVLV